jgi:hypothetical protein
MKTLEQLDFHNSYADLSDDFYRRVAPEPLQQAHLASFNAAAARLIGLDPEQARRPEFVALFGGARIPRGADPLAALYAGHQFGHYVPQLGDGRAITLGELQNAAGERWELQLKGSGETPYSRDGDGRAVLRSTIREYLCSEAMHGLGIPSTRALCMFGSGEEVYREQIETGAILVRMAPSHVRFGSFEVFYYRRQFEHIRTLADYVIERHFPALLGAQTAYVDLLREVVRRTARLIADWQAVGFAHGVMNTDNMSILGLTLDYGPFGFIDAYQPDFNCNHSDRWGRYAFDRQPQIALWNLSCLAQALLPLFNAEDGEAAAETANAVLSEFQPAFEHIYAERMRAKLGLLEARDKDALLWGDLLRRMAEQRVDYTRLFRALGAVEADTATGDAAARDLFVERAAFDQWAADYRARLRSQADDEAQRRERMRCANPVYILRNYLAQQAIEKAQKGDYSEIDRLLRLLQKPFDEQAGMQAYAAEPPDWGKSLALSCSS